MLIGCVHEHREHTRLRPLIGLVLLKPFKAHLTMISNQQYKNIATLRGPQEVVTSLVFSARAKFLAATGKYNLIEEVLHLTKFLPKMINTTQAA